jgi:hypothetical protein
MNTDRRFVGRLPSGGAGVVVRGDAGSEDPAYNLDPDHRFVGRLPPGGAGVVVRGDAGSGDPAYSTNTRVPYL